MIAEAEGHAICVEDDLDENTFGNEQVRCIMLGGTRFAVCKDVKKSNLALGKRAMHMMTNGGNQGDASDSGDGNRNTFSVSPRLSDPWWRVEMDRENQGTYAIDEIIIYSRFDRFPERLSDVRGMLFEFGDIENPVFNERYVDEVEEIFTISGINKVVRDPVVHITLLTQNGQPMPHMVSEVEVYGKPVLSQLTSYDIPIGDLFAGNDLSVRYIGFIQDNDSEPLAGESRFQGIELYEGDGENTDGAIVSVICDVL